MSLKHQGAVGCFFVETLGMEKYGNGQMLPSKGEPEAFHSFGRVLLQVVTPSLSL